MSFFSSAAVFAQMAPEGFRQVLPGDIKWLPSEIVPGGQVVILLGDPDKPGPLVVRIKSPSRIKIMPHTHPDARTYSVLSGEWQLGFGYRFQSSALRTFSPGSIYRLPAGVAHFQATGTRETIVQIESIGPSGIDFLKQSDKTRNKQSR
jgi:hypothetical protein